MNIHSAERGDWQMGSGHTIKTEYHLNSTGELISGENVLLWSVTTNANGEPTGAISSIPAPGTLLKTSVTDENGNTNIVYRDMQGRVICRRTDAYTDVDDKTRDFTDGGNSRTGGMLKSYLSYYVYDIKGRLTYFIPPAAVLRMGTIHNFSFRDDNALSDVIFREFIYGYYYDIKDRQVEKYTPGAGREYCVYNKMDLIMMSQDEKQRIVGEWAFRKFDAIGRVIVTGKCQDNRTQKDIQVDADAATTVYEVRDNSSYGYSQSSTPQSITEIFSVNYFDNYDFAFDNQLNGLIYKQYGTNEKTNRTSGMPTASKVKVLGTNQYLYTIIYYNEKGQSIQTQIQNYIDNANSWDVTNYEYNFSGHPLHSERKHTAFGNDPLIIKTDYFYDHIGRLVDITKQVNDETPIHYVHNEFNGIGQLVRKNLHYDYHFPADYMQRVDYRYNIRGWQKSINNSELVNDMGITNEDDNDVFGEEIFYNELGPDNSRFNSLPQYNGNINSVKWRTRPYSASGASISYRYRPIHCYDYRYDDFNRLTVGYYAHNDDVDPASFNQEINGYTEKESYDITGNMRTLQRNISDGNTGITMDDLTYNYTDNGNRLEKVTDAVTADFHFSDFKDNANTSIEYHYDVNGNQVSDDNKGLNTSYNILNLPNEVIEPGTGNSVQFLHDAAGNKLRKTAGGSVHDYVNGIEYENNVLQFVTTEEGRVRPKNPHATNTDNFVYDYMIKDHLGNVRVVLSNEILKYNYFATMEDANDQAERQLFYNIPTTRDDKPVTMPADSTYTPDAKVSALDPANGKPIGHAKSLYVNAGDLLSIDTKYYFSGNPFVQNTPRNITDILTQLTGIFFPGYTTGTLSAEQLQSAQQSFTQNAGLNSFLIAALGDAAGDNTKPMAFLTWIMLDEKFNFIPEASGILKAESPDQLGNLAVMDLKIPVNGYLYIYVSNETPDKEVDFDNLEIGHVPGYVAEENHYYPFGLLIEQLRYSNRTNPINKNKYQDKEWQNDMGMNMLDFGARQYDAVLGRWITPDPMHQCANPYLAMGNNPISMIDPSGMSYYEYGYDGLFSQAGSGGGWGGGNDPWADGGWGADGRTMNSYAPSPGYYTNLLNNDYGINSLPQADHNQHWVNQSTVTFITSSCDEFTLPYSNGKIITFTSNVNGDYEDFETSVTIDGYFEKGNAQGGGGANSSGVFWNNVNTGIGAFDVGQGAKGELINYAAKSSPAINDLKYVKGFKVLGGVTFVASTVISGGLATNYYMNGGTNSSVGIKASLDIIMGGVGFLGPIGFGMSAAYFLLDAGGAFQGWGDPLTTPKK